MKKVGFPILNECIFISIVWRSQVSLCYFTCQLNVLKNRTVCSIPRCNKDTLTMKYQVISIENRSINFNTADLSGLLKSYKRYVFIHCFALHYKQIILIPCNQKEKSCQHTVFFCPSEIIPRNIKLLLLIIAGQISKSVLIS